jgi:hypothetical protein
MDKKQVKTIAKGEVKAHEARMHKGKGYRAGGKTNSDMLKMGRNLAKVANQKSPGRKQQGV